MITIKNNNKSKPYQELRRYYKKALNLEQKNIEAILISSYSKTLKEVDSRLVNLKFVDNKNFVFFSNYESAKSKQFSSHSQISAVIFWNEANVQIRMKANIAKIPYKDSDKYFKERNKSKNALAISSNQSREIKSYSEVCDKYKETLEGRNLEIRPDYWGGYYFIPYYFEYWEGHKSRLNHRVAYVFENNNWLSSTLEP